MSAYVKSPSGVYLIQDTRQYVGNCVLWWVRGSSGYTTEFHEAGRYNEAYLSGLRDTDRPIPIEVAEQACCTHVRAERLSLALAALRVPS